MYNNGFTVNYPQMVMPQLPTFQPQQQPQTMTQPTIHADIIQIETEQEAWNQNVNVGSSQMMMLRDESAIFIKSAYPDKQPTMDIYRKETRKAVPSPADYVTKDELAAALAALKPAKKTAKEAAEDGTV